MSDNLTVFGVDYTNVTGIKAHATSDSSLVAYIRPSGTKSIAANGTGIDVTEYASVNVAVPAQDNSLIVTLSWDDDYFGADEGAWVPDCTFAEIQAAYLAGKTLVVRTDVYADAYCSDIDMPTWFTYEVAAPAANKVLIYELNSNSLQLLDEIPIIVPNFDSPTRTYTPTTSQQTETITYDPNDGFNGIEQVSVTVNAMPTGTAGTPTATKGTVSNHSVSVTPSVTNSAGYISGGTHTGTAVSVTASELVSGTYTVDSSGTKDVTNYASASVPAGTAGTPSASKGTVSNHSVNVTPSVTNSTGWITGSTKTGTAVTVSASELVSGSQTVTTNDTYDVTNLAELVVNVSGGGSSAMNIGTKTATLSAAASSISFTGLSGNPLAFVVTSSTNQSTGSTTAVAVAYDGTSLHGMDVTTQAEADTGYTKTYSGGTLTVTATTATFAANEYKLVYAYGGSSSDIHTADVQVGSGATSITFTGLSGRPLYFSCVFKSSFSTSSGYQRVIDVVNDGTSTYGHAFDSSAKAQTSWSYTYSGGSLTISSTGTNNGGYFHQPGYYGLVYAVDPNALSYQNKTGVGATTSSQTIYADAGYDALESVQIDAVSQTNLTAANIKNGTTVTVSNGTTNLWSVTGTYTGGGGGSASVATTTWSNSSNTTTSHQFTNLSGTPKAAFLRCTSSLSRSSNSSNYFIADMVWDGTSCKGNSFRRSNGTYANVTSGYTVTTGSNSITFTSSGTSTTNPGSFYNGSYELTYVY